MGAHQGTWEQPAIVGDSRIDHDDPNVRALAEYLHRNESMHMHVAVGCPVCVYCALRASNAVRFLRASVPVPEPSEGEA